MSLNRRNSTPTSVFAPNRCPRIQGGVTRRQMFGAGLALLAGNPAQAETAQRAWSEFRTRFLTADGRVVDTGNQGVSHSEGQGYGLLLAAA